MTATYGFNLEGVLEKLPNEGFLALHSAFGSGVNIDEFVRIIFRECAQNDRSLWNDDKRLQFEGDLRQLFTIIDVNGNESVSWEEFSHYIMYAVQAPETSESKDIVRHIAFDYNGRCSVESTRLRSMHVEYIRLWDKYVLLECGATSSRLALFTKQSRIDSETPPLRVHAEFRTSCLFESMAFVESLRMLAATTTNGKLQLFTVSEDPVLEESGQMQRLLKMREHHLEGRHTVLRYDQESRFLFAGNRDGIVTVINPEDDTRVSPAIVQQVRLHKQPILDLCVLPERGNKKMITSALDGKVQMFDVVRTDFYGELGSAVAAHSMAFCDEYSMLVTCSNKDLDPLLWAPHAVRNVFVGRLESARPSQRTRLVQALCPRGTPYCFTADVMGQIKLWDLRKMRQVFSFYGDGDPTKNDMSPQLTLRSFAADPRTLDVVSFCRSEFGNGLEMCKSKLVSSRDPLVSHDSPVVGCSVCDRNGWLFTASEDCVKIWSTKRGEVLHHFKNILTDGDKVSCFAADPEGRRMYLGTQGGYVVAVSTTTCGILGAGIDHKSPLLQLALHRGVLFSLSKSGDLFATDVKGDEPVVQFICRRDVAECRAMCMDVSTNLSCMVVGFENGMLEINDCAEHSHGAVVGRVRPVVASLSAVDDDEISQYMTPPVAEVSVVKICDPRGFFCYGDTKGSLGLVACRPHPKALQRFCWWKTFFPKSTSTFFAVAVSMEWNEKTCSLLVGDDQGNLTVWDCEEVIEKYCFVPCHYPATMKHIISLPTPTEAPLVYNPKLRGYFTLSATLTPLRLLQLIADDILVMANDKTVMFASTTGDHCGSLLQGRGTILDAVCEPFEMNYGSGSMQDTITVAQSPESAIAVPSDSPPPAPVCIIPETEYEILCQRSSLRSFARNRQKTTVESAAVDKEAGSKLTVQDETLFDCYTPPPSPQPHFHLQSRVTSKLPRPVTPLTFPGSTAVTDEVYYSPLKQVIVRDSSPLSNQSRRQVNSQECAFPDLASRVVSEACKKLTDWIPDVPHGFVAVASRAAPINLRPPTLAAVFSTDLSFCSDWKSKLLQHPHKTSRWVQQTVTSFVPPAVLAAPTQPLSVAPLSAPKLGELSHPCLTGTSENSQKKAARRTLLNSIRNTRGGREAPVPLSDAIEAVTPVDSDRGDEKSIHNFKMPQSLHEFCANEERIARDVGVKVNAELNRRMTMATRKLTSSADVQKAIDDVCVMQRVRSVSALCPSSDRTSPALTSTAPTTVTELRTRPSTPPSLSFGVPCVALHPSQSWNSASKPLNTVARPRSSASACAAAPLQSNASDSRREYVQFLVHLPRIKESLRFEDKNN